MSNLAVDKRLHTRDTILEAGKDLFSRKGYHNTQVMDIVRAVGMSAGTFYNHFKDKRELFEQITQESFDDLRVKIKQQRQPLNIWDRDDRALKLTKTFDAYFDYLEAHKQQILIMFRASFGIDDELDYNIWNYYRGITQDLVEDIQQWIDIGIIKDIKPYPLAHAIVGMAMHLGHSYIVENEFSREDAIDTLIRLCMGVFDTSINKDVLKGNV